MLAQPPPAGDEQMVWALGIGLTAALAALLWRVLWRARSAAARRPPPAGDRPLAIIGGGFSGLSLARRAVDNGLRVVIFEKRHDHSGVWSVTGGIANVGSQLQSDYIIYKDLSDPLYSKLEFSKFYPPRAEIEQVLAQRARRLVQDGAEIRYGCDVTRLVDQGADGVQVRYSKSEEGAPQHLQETFASVHVRTGTLSIPRAPNYPGLEQFDGRWCLGVANGLERVPVAGNRVVVIGMGAFAIENAKRAVELGAASVTFLTRSGNIVCPRALIHHGGTSTLKLSNMFNKKELDARWKELFEILKQAPSTDAFDINSAIFQHRGLEHYKFNSSSQSDWFYAALKLGVVRVRRGEIVRVTSERSCSIKTPAGVESLEADVLCFSMGNACDTKLLDGIPLTSVMFGFDGRVTHNLKADSFQTPCAFGPRCPIPMFPVLSYGLVGDFVDTVTVCSLLDDRFYDRWCRATAIRLHPELQYIVDVKGYDWVEFFWSCFMAGIPEVGGELLSRFYDRYEEYLAAPDWHDQVEAEWNEQVLSLQKYRHEVHGEPLNSEVSLPYPWKRPKSLQPQRRSKAFYKMMYSVVSMLGVRRMLTLGNESPLLQWCMQRVL